MEKQDSNSGAVLVQSVREKFHKSVPSRPLRIILILASAMLLAALAIGIVFGCIAIGSCRAVPVEGQAKPVENAIQRPGMIGETVEIVIPTDAPSATPIPEETAAPSDNAGETPAPQTQTDYLGGRTFQKGDTDAIIPDVQAKLMDLGYMDSDEPTDFFGPYTLDALTAFQRHNDLEANGVLNETTYALLMYGSPKEYVMQEGDSGDDVLEVQDRLYELGYLDKGSRTGTFGEKTAAAIRAFQSANKLKVDGKVGAKTLNSLYSSDVVGNVYKSGDTDENIKPYQERLIKLGYLSKDYNAKGKMDNKTVSAIKMFQEANGLVRDGCLGPATMEQISSKDAVKYAMRLGMSGSNIKEAQSRLHKLGYLRSHNVTGYFGEATETAVLAFQKRNGLSQTGEINEKTLEKLNSDKAKKASSSSSGGEGGKTTPTPKPGTTPKPSGGSSSQNLKGVEKLIKIAEEKIGCRYVRGAKGPNSFDCSGFVYWCLNQAGVRQSYMTSIIWRSCTKYKRIESMSDLKRGDILVFKGESMSTGHVGIYLGNGKMIDASSSRGQVRITESNILKSNYWQSHFLMAYRIWG